MCFENVATEILLLFSAFANTLGVNVSHCVVDKTACCVLLPHVYNFSSKDLENCKSVNQIGKNTQFTSLYFLPYQNHPPLILEKKKKKPFLNLEERGIQGRMNACIHAAESLCCSSATITNCFNWLYPSEK